MSPVDFFAAGWCLPVIIMDLTRRRVRWWWSLAGLAAAAVHRLVIWIMEGISFPELLLIAFVLAASWQLWKQSAWGGADAKTAMTLVLVQPFPGCCGYDAVPGSQSRAGMAAVEGCQGARMVFGSGKGISDSSLPVPRHAAILFSTRSGRHSMVSKLVSCQMNSPAQFSRRGCPVCAAILYAPMALSGRRERRTDV